MENDKSNLQKQTELVLAYKRLFNSDDGEKVLYDLIQNTYHISSIIHYDRSGQFNAYMSFFHEGERNVVLKILSILDKTPEDIKSMYSEIKKDSYDYFR